MHLQQSVRMQGLFYLCAGAYSKITLSLRFVSAFVKCLALQLPIVIWNLLTYTGKKKKKFRNGLSVIHSTII